MKHYSETFGTPVGAIFGGRTLSAVGRVNMARIALGDSRVATIYAEPAGPDRTDAWANAAYLQGRADALAAASWTIDGNTSSEHIARVLSMLDDGDPQTFDYLPARPDLSGQWADALTPRSLFEDVTGLDAHAESSWNFDAYWDVVGALCMAYELGVSDTFEPECERILRAALPSDD